MKKITAAVLLALASLANAEEMALGVTVKGLAAPAVDLIVLQQNGRYYIEPAALDALGLREVKGWRTVEIERTPWLDVASLGMLVINKSTLTASLELPVDQLPLQKVDARRVVAALPKAEAGAFMNYRIGQLAGQAGSTYTGMLEAHKTTATGWDFGVSAGGSTQAGSQIVIGDFNAIHRDPEARQTLTIGTAYSTAGAIGSAARFVGIQKKTDNSLNPGYITSPGLTFAGLATAPSTAQLFVNGQPTGSADLNAGPFQLNNVTIPYTAGGEVVAQVKGLDGQTQTITGRLIGAPFNLKAGTDSFSFEAGALRKGSQIKAGDLFAAGTYARGITDTLTLEGHVEASEKARAGVHATLATRVGTFMGGVAAGTHGQGAMTKAGYVLSGKSGSFSVSRTNASEFVDFDNRRMPSMTAISTNYRITEYLSTSANYAKFNGGSRVTAGFSYNFLPNASVSVVADQTRYDNPAQNSKGLFAYLNVSFGGKYSSSTAFRSENRADGQKQGYVSETFQVNRTEYTGFRANVNATAYRSGAQHQRADLSYAGLHGEIQAVAATDGKATNTQIFGSGSIVFAENGAHLARTIDDSYAVVKVENGEAGIPITHWNNVVAKTDADGVAVIARTHAFIKNKYDFSATDLPDSILATKGAEGTPYRHAPAKIAITAKRPGFFLDIVGAISPVVDIAGKRGKRMSDGSYYVEDVQSGKHHGKAGGCEFEVEIDLAGRTDLPLFTAVCSNQTNLLKGEQQ